MAKSPHSFPFLFVSLVREIMRIQLFIYKTYFGNFSLSFSHCDLHQRIWWFKCSEMWNLSNFISQKKRKSAKNYSIKQHLSSWHLTPNVLRNGFSHTSQSLLYCYLAFGASAKRDLSIILISRTLVNGGKMCVAWMKRLFVAHVEMANRTEIAHRLR